MLNSVFANDVRQTMDHFRRSVDQIFDSFYGYPAQRQSAPAAEGENRWVFSPAVESGWTDEHLNLRAIVPGVSEKDIKVSIHNNQLLIEGERKAPEGFAKNTFTQLAYGPFYTAVTLPTGVDVDKLACRLHDGVLDIRIPMAESVKPRQIPIQTGDQKALNASR